LQCLPGDGIFYRKIINSMNIGALHQHNIGWVVKDINNNEYPVQIDQLNINNIHKFKISKIVNFEILDDNYVKIIWLDN
jgi:hypothetical protein